MCEELLSLWIEAMCAQNLSVRTIDERVRCVRAISRAVGTPARDLTTVEIARWLAGMETRATRYTYYLHLRAWFHWLELTERRVGNPMVRLLPPKRPSYQPRPCHTEQIVRVLSSGRCYQVTRVRILFAALAGLRVSEIAALRSRDFDFCAGTLLVHSKGGRDDVLPLHPVLIELARKQPGSGWWWPSRTGSGHVSGSGVGASIKTAFERCGYSVKAHQLRHYFATELLAAGVDSRVVQTLMRHRSVETTARYLAVVDTQQRGALGLLPASLMAVGREVVDLAG